MSHSPDSKALQIDPQASDRAYRKYLSELDQLVENGASWSGHERNCAFLNLGRSNDRDPEFATVSSVTGLDFLDDGRAHALLDWDADGDIDVWSVNRTAPRVRYLQNMLDNDNHFVALRLVGRNHVNHDAVGAHVEVVVPGGNDQPLVRSVRAGGGFLSQSTKWLYFGLGKQNVIEKVVINWPGAGQQVLTGLKVDRFYKLTLGVELPSDITPRPPAMLAQDSAPLTRPEHSPKSATHVLLTSRMPLPRIDYTTFAGGRQNLAALGQPTCVNLWATWCAPCVQELSELPDHVELLEKHGLRFIALSVDGLTQTRATQEKVKTLSTEDVQQFLKSLNLSCEGGMATEETLRRLQFVQGMPFGRSYDLRLPCSFLIDAKGRLAAIYRGPLSWDRLWTDVATLDLDERRLLQAALPFPGTWFDGRRRFAPLAMVANLFDHRHYSDAFEYLRTNHEELAKQQGFVDVVGVLGTALAQRTDVKSAVTCYRWALQRDPNHVPTLNNLAWYLATDASAEVRNGKEAVRLAERAAQRTNYQSASVLDTLAAAYAENGEFDKSLTTVDRALDLARQNNDLEQIDRLTNRRRTYADKRPFRAS